MKKFLEKANFSVNSWMAKDLPDLTLHIPPKHKHLIRYYGLYSSRTKGKAAQVGRYGKLQT